MFRHLFWYLFWVVTPCVLVVLVVVTQSQAYHIISIPIAWIAIYINFNIYRSLMGERS